MLATPCMGIDHGGDEADSGTGWAGRHFFAFSAFLPTTWTQPGLMYIVNVVVVGGGLGRRH